MFRGGNIGLNNDGLNNDDWLGNDDWLDDIGVNTGNGDTGIVNDPFEGVIVNEGVTNDPFEGVIVASGTGI